LHATDTLAGTLVDRLQKVSELPAEYPGWMIKTQSTNRFPEPPEDA